MSAPGPILPLDASALATENTALKTQVSTLGEQVAALKQQLAWFQRQLFGAKSEKRLDVAAAGQADLLAGLEVPPEALPPAPVETVTYSRRKKQRDADSVTERPPQLRQHPGSAELAGGLELRAAFRRRLRLRSHK